MITRIKIKNFRTLLDVDVTLEPLTVLIGRSGTGKSNFVEAIKFIRDRLNDPTCVPLNWPGHYLPVSRPSVRLRIEVDFRIPDYDGDWSYRLELNPDSSVFEERLDRDAVVLLHQHEGQWLKQPGGPVSPAGKVALRGSLASDDCKAAYTRLLSGIGIHDFPKSVLTDEGRSGLPLDRGFCDSGRNYLQIAELIRAEALPRWRGITKAMKAIRKSVSALILDGHPATRLDVTYQRGGESVSLDIRRESEGFRFFLAHLFALNQPSRKATLLFEHPEQGLHPSAMEALFGEFQDAKTEGRQVISTTHNPVLLDYFSTNEIRVVEIEDEETKIGRLDPSQEGIRRTGMLLTVDDARLAPVG